MDSQPVFSAGHKAFILATDGSSTAFHPENDQVWELQMPQNEVYPFCLHTTYGLRAQTMRLFPILTIGNQHYYQAAAFYAPPAITQYLPDAITIQASPTDTCDFTFEAHIAAEDTLVGGVTIENSGESLLSMALDLAMIMVSMPQGSAAYADREGIKQIITGHTKDLAPVLFMTGGPSAISSPYPALTIPIHLAPHQSRRLTWALATKTSRDASLDAARKVAASNWRETVQQHQVKQAAQTMQVQSGHPEWDTAFTLAQTEAQIHWVSEVNGEVSPFFLRSRLPDDAPDNAIQQNRKDDLTLLEAFHLRQILLPAQSDQYAAVLANFRKRQQADGAILSQRLNFAFSRPFHDPPLLASQHLSLYELIGDAEFLQSAFPTLRRALDPWLSEGSAPQRLAWEDPRQLQLDTGLFNFDLWDDSGHGLDIQTAESPALLAMLLMEVKALIQIADILADAEASAQYKKTAKLLTDRIHGCWDERLHTFIYRDSQSGLTPERELFYPGRVQKEVTIGKTFLTHQRLQLHLIAADEHTRSCLIRLQGTDQNDHPLEESFTARDLRWVLGRAHLTSRQLYQSIRSISFEGLQPEDRFLLETADYAQPDITCLLPLHTAAPTDEMIESLAATRAGIPESDLAFGLPETWRARHELPPSLTLQSNVLWNTLIIEGLLQSGLLEEAAQAFTRLMTAISAGLIQHGGFFPFYNSKDGLPAGNRNALAGLAPVGLFLELSGIKILSPSKVILWERFPFEKPVTVHWQGLSIYKDDSLAKVVFPDGTDFTGAIEEPIIVSSKSDKR
jgi:hypothetical protein